MKTMFRSVLVALMTFSVSAAALAEDDAEPFEPAKVFEGACLDCHDGVMKYMHTGPELLTLEWTEERRAEALEVIAKGTVDETMPAFGETMSEAESAALVAWIAETSEPPSPSQ